MVEAFSPLRILVFCTGRIDRPRAGGDLRIHHLYRELSERGYRVDLFSLVARNHPAGRVRINENFNVNVEHSVCLDLALLCDKLGVVPITELPGWLRPLRGWVAELAGREAYD